MPRFDALRRFVHEDETHLVELTRHFFGRFFDNEFVSQTGESALGVAHVVVLLAAPGFIYFFFLYTAYSQMAELAPGLFDPTSMRDEFIYVCLSMLVIGLLAVLEWDSFFPDRVDFLTLVPLPTRAGSIFLAKASALVVFLFMFAAAVGAPGTLGFPLAASGGTHVTFGGICRWSLVHGLTMAAASTFSFLFFVALEGVLLTVLSYRWFEKASAYLQGGLIASVLMFSLLLPKMVGDLSALLHSSGPLARWLPPLWFLGLYRAMLHYPDPAYLPLARRAVLGVAAVLVISITTYLASYRRHLRRSLEAGEAPPREPRQAGRALRRLIQHTFLREALERVAFSFVFKTILGSRRHRLLFSAYTGVGVALALESAAALLSHNAVITASGRAAIFLSIPLIISFFVLSGTRLIFEIPAEVRANWIFQLTERQTNPALRSGVRKAMIVLGTIPILTLVFPIYALHLSFGEAAAALLLDFLLALILIEVLLLRFRKIPFTCSYLASKSGNFAVWLGCWLMFSSYAYTLARAEDWALRNPAELVAPVALLLLGLWWLRFYNRRFLREGNPLVFEEEPQPAVQTLDLSHSALEHVRGDPGRQQSLPLHWDS
ncbi:MAG: hypothetical protein ABSF46_10255 [Terriglobia bacterium]|jgi:hypothetical protein